MRLILFSVFIFWSALAAHSQPGKLMKLAEAASAEGRYAESNELLGQFMAQYPNRLYDKGQALWLESYNFLQQELFPEALAANQASFGLMEQFVPDALAPSYFRYGEIYLRLGQYERALWNLLQAEEFPLMDEPELAAAIKEHIGMAYSSLGQHQRARLYLQAAIATLQVELDEAVPRLGDCYFQLGESYLQTDEPAAAAQQYRLALETEEALGSEAWRPSRALNALGRAALAAGELEAARQYYAQAYQRSSSQGSDAEAARALLLLAQLQSQLGELPEAQILLSHVLGLACPDLADGTAERAPCLPRLLAAEALQAQALIALETYERSPQTAHLEQALAASQRGLALLEKEINLLAAAAARLPILDTYHGLYEAGIRSALLLHQQAGQAAHAEEAFRFSERARVMGLRLQRLSREAVHAPQGRLEARARQARLALRAAERAYGEQQQTVVDEEAGASHPPLISFARKPGEAAAKKRLDLQRQAYQAFLDSLREMAPAFYRENFGFETATLSALRQGLGPQSLVLSYWLGEKKYCLFAISREGFELWQLDKTRAGKPGLEEAADGFLQALQAQDAAAYAEHAHALYRWLIEPAASLAKKKKELIIVPHGLLAHLPFEAFLRSPTKKGDRPKFEKLPYLGSEFRLAYSPAASWLAKGPPEGRVGGLLALAPGFSGSDRVAEANRWLFDTAYQTAPGLRAVSPDGKHIAQLAFAASELAAAFSAAGQKAAVLSGAEATEEAFKDQAGAACCLHLAAHGFAHERHPALTGIALAQPEGESAEDGILFAREIAQLELGGKLVALSHFHGATGNSSWTAGWLPFCWPFLEAGAAQVLMPRWAGSPAAPELFPRFYRHLLSGLSAVEALHRTRLESLRDKNTAPPWQWSNLVLVVGSEF